MRHLTISTSFWRKVLDASVRIRDEAAGDSIETSLKDEGSIFGRLRQYGSVRLWRLAPVALSSQPWIVPRRFFCSRVVEVKLLAGRIIDRMPVVARLLGIGIR